MKKPLNKWIARALDRPKLVVWTMVSITVALVAFAVLPTLVPGAPSSLARIRVDADPENMLDHNEPARVFHRESRKRFDLHDGIVVGIVNTRNKFGVFNKASLGKLHALTRFAKTLDGVIAADVLALSTVDSIQNTGPGAIEFRWLMSRPPQTDAEAAAVRKRALRIALFRGTLYSEDEKALALYLPLEKKSYAHSVAVALKKKIDELGGPDKFYIAGLPIVEETFGIEMFKQMAMSAPLAMLVIFLLMWFFFRRLIIIVSPMIVAMVAALSTMALLVITGNTIHIMSSMIPIFIMPIAVLDAVHIISDFFDRYEPGEDRRSLVSSVMSHLFTPMLFTSLTTAVGFASLAFTPIPPVRVFGIFVAIGVVLAWLATILFVPAFLMMVSEKRLVGFGRKAVVDAETARTGGILARLGEFTYRRARWVLVGTLALSVVGVVGITKINVNDNPTKWFEEGHPIRVADRVMNKHFGGTYNAFLSFAHHAPKYSAKTYRDQLANAGKARRAAIATALTKHEQSIAAHKSTDAIAMLEQLLTQGRKIKQNSRNPSRYAGLDAVDDFIAEQLAVVEDLLEGEATAVPLTSEVRAQLVAATKQHATAVAASFGKFERKLDTVAASSPADAKTFRDSLGVKVRTDSAASEKAVATFVASLAQLNQVFKRPDVLRYLDKLAQHLNKHASVGKTSSLSDVVKTVNRDMVSGKEKDYRIPSTSRAVAGGLDQYLSSHRKDDLWHFVTPDYQSVAIWVQLNSGDNKHMESVVAEVQRYVKAHPAPVQLSPPRWFGLTYINVVWQDSMVSGMMSALFGSFVIVMIMMMLLFRSALWGALSMIPLTVTVGLIYGVTGLVGKDYDMPVAVLSSLSLGLAVDYAIHFLARSRDLTMLHGSWRKALPEVFGEPSRAISRNVVVVGVGFLPLLAAPLVPYQSVGVLIASILILAGAASLVILPALITLLRRWLFPQDQLPDALVHKQGASS